MKNIVPKLIELSYHEGYSSYIRGCSADHCWYEAGSADAINWLNGWKNAEADAEVKRITNVEEIDKKEIH